MIISLGIISEFRLYNLEYSSLANIYSVLCTNLKDQLKDICKILHDTIEVTQKILENSFTMYLMIIYYKILQSGCFFSLG